METGDLAILLGILVVFIYGLSTEPPSGEWATNTEFGTSMKEYAWFASTPESDKHDVGAAPPIPLPPGQLHGENSLTLSDGNDDDLDLSLPCPPLRAVQEAMDAFYLPMAPAFTPFGLTSPTDGSSPDQLSSPSTQRSLKARPSPPDSPCLGCPAPSFISLVACPPSAAGILAVRSRGDDSPRRKLFQFAAEHMAKQSRPASPASPRLEAQPWRTSTAGGAATAVAAGGGCGYTGSRPGSPAASPRVVDLRRQSVAGGTAAGASLPSSPRSRLAPGLQLQVEVAPPQLLPGDVGPLSSGERSVSGESWGRSSSDGGSSSSGAGAGAAGCCCSDYEVPPVQEVPSPRDKASAVAAAAAASTGISSATLAAADAAAPAATASSIPASAPAAVAPRSRVGSRISPPSPVSVLVRAAEFEGLTRCQGQVPRPPASPVFTPKPVLPAPGKATWAGTSEGGCVSRAPKALSRGTISGGTSGGAPGKGTGSPVHNIRYASGGGNLLRARAPGAAGSSGSGGAFGSTGGGVGSAGGSPGPSFLALARATQSRALAAGSPAASPSSSPSPAVSAKRLAKPNMPRIAGL